MFPSENSHPFKYHNPDYESESTEMSYSSLHKPKDSFFYPKEPHFYTPTHPKDTSYSKDTSFYSKDTTFNSKDSMSFNKDPRRSRHFCKDEESVEPAISKKLFVEDPYERYRAKTTSFMDRRQEFYRDNGWNAGNNTNTINFTNVNSLAHFQRKNPLMDMKCQMFESLKYEDNSNNKEVDSCFEIGKTSRGLKNLSIKVREFVIKYKETTYKEIADQLLKEMKRGKHGIDNPKEEQNIKRRIYDALNVLVATEIFKKKGKTVYYDGKSNVMGHDMMNKRALFDREEVQTKIVIILLNNINFLNLNYFFSNKEKNSFKPNIKVFRPFW
jgi:hypothetical protein